jgi:hypothetical protein
MRNLWVMDLMRINHAIGSILLPALVTLVIDYMYQLKVHIHEGMTCGYTTNVMDGSLPQLEGPCIVGPIMATVHSLR